GLDPGGPVGFEVGDAAVAPAAQLAAGQFGEPPLDEVEPAARGGREMQVEPGVRGQPGLDRGSLVGRRDLCSSPAVAGAESDPVCGGYGRGSQTGGVYRP